MPKLLKILFTLTIITLTAFAFGIYFLWTHRLTLITSLIPTPPPGSMYPAAPPMPAAVPTPVEDLLSQHEAFLKSHAPATGAALLPGLTDLQIDALEATYSVKLTPDLRALYRWHNGSNPASSLSAFPDHLFIPLDTALANREDLRKQVKASTPDQRKAFATFAGHTDSWIGLIVDPAGDGHFFDPTRTESEGSFFFNFKEEGSYIFYLAFRNYLAAVVEGEKSGTFVTGPQGLTTTDFIKADTLWKRFGAPAHV